MKARELIRMLRGLEEYELKDCALTYEILTDLDAEPIRHGEWVKKESETTYWWECSECGEEPLRGGYGQRAFSRYCPSCGALLDKVNDG